MSITDQADIKMRINHLNIYTFEKPVPTISVLILNECEQLINYLNGEIC
jgi:hypothetical protein